jgi:HK97 family phage prohead protease
MSADPVRKFVSAFASVEGLADKRQVLVNCSAGGVDRQGDIVVQDGIDTANFMKTGGTVLWNHKSDTPIARALSIGVEAGQLRSLVQFPDAGVSAKADEIYGLVKAGVVSSTSIGFQGLEWEPMDPKEPWGGRKFLKCELMEFSFVSVPAMPDATVIARSNEDGGKPRWKCGASLNLPILTVADDGGFKETRAAIFEHADFGGAAPDLAFARKGFLVYDSAAPRDANAYAYRFAHMVDGRLSVSAEAVARVRENLHRRELPIPDDILAKAHAVLDHYEAKMNAFTDWSKVKAALTLKADPQTVEYLKALVEADKAGRVLSAANMAHVEGLSKCLEGMADGHAKALDVHGQAAAQLEDFAAHLNAAADHCKALMNAKPKPQPDAADAGGAADPDGDAGADVELATQAAQRKRAIAIAAAAI